MKTHHISLLTRDAEKNVHFYTKILGMRLVKNTVNQENIRIRHLFYGDYLGTPGTVVTFFVVPMLGPRTDAKRFFNTIRLSVPNGSLDYWKDRLHGFGIQTDDIEEGISFKDSLDDVTIKFVETHNVLSDWHVVKNTDVPAKYQITRLMGSELHIPDPTATANFFHDWMGLQVIDNVVQLEDGQAIELFKSPNNDRTRFGRGSIDHFAFAVPDLKTLDNYYHKALDMKLNFEEYIDRGWFKSLYVRDPGNNRVELATTEPGFSLEEPILTMGSQLSLTPKFENKRQEILDFYAKEGVDFHDVDD